MKGFIDGQGWLFSQPKTGTNLIASTVAFYSAELLGDDKADFDDRYRLGMVHGTRIIRDAAGITKALRFHRASTRMMITRWHEDVPEAKPRLLIATTRNLFDQMASLWHFNYKAHNVPVAKVIPDMVERIAWRNRDQSAAMARADQAIGISYEALMADPHAQLRPVIAAAYGDVDDDALAAALRRGSSREFKRWEQERGKAAIKPKLAKFQSSFIRPGKIGEGESFFTARQRAKIEALAARANLRMDCATG